MQENTRGERGGDPGEGSRPIKDESFSQALLWGRERDPGELGSKGMPQRAPTRGVVAWRYLHTQLLTVSGRGLLCVEMGWVVSVSVFIPWHLSPSWAQAERPPTVLGKAVIQRDADTDTGIPLEDTKVMIPWALGQAQQLLLCTPSGAYLLILFFHRFLINFIFWLY